nr:hypothetical protein Iba_chr12aCG2130 [Ipomoea batatas]
MVVEEREGAAGMQNPTIDASFKLDGVRESVCALSDRLIKATSCFGNAASWQVSNGENEACEVPPFHSADVTPSPLSLHLQLASQVHTLAPPPTWQIATS